MPRGRVLWRWASARASGLGVDREVVGAPLPCVAM
ncbi:hypothetical protein BJ984_002203 [Herbiconiux flava]|uniref:Uncharacterized protein n=1 Tax=Herbiconiux flava TaxID=881268 RepID=A0A852SQJ4_9MICO|nr:hypothetical protein [Herbiconiux flava]